MHFTNFRRSIVWVHYFWTRFKKLIPLFCIILGSWGSRSSKHSINISIILSKNHLSVCTEETTPPLKRKANLKLAKRISSKIVVCSYFFREVLGCFADFFCLFLNDELLSSQSLEASFLSILFLLLAAAPCCPVMEDAEFESTVETSSVKIEIWNFFAMLRRKSSV